MIRLYIYNAGRFFLNRAPMVAPAVTSTTPNPVIAVMLSPNRGTANNADVAGTMANIKEAALLPSDNVA